MAIYGKGDRLYVRDFIGVKALTVTVAKNAQKTHLLAPG
jgi:hypothetical protein